MRIRTGFVMIVAVVSAWVPDPSSSPAEARQASAASQESRSSLSGSLLDPTGRTLPGVLLSVVDTATGQRYETRTDAVGQFSVDRLPASDYRIEVSVPGFEPVAGRVVLERGQRVERDVVPRIVRLLHKYKVSANAAAGGSATDQAGPTGPKRLIVPTAVPVDRCKGTTASGCLTPPTRIVEAWPVYPRALAEKGVSGTVEIEARLGTDGFLADFRSNDGANPEFVACAIEALRLWEYSPLRLNGVPQQGRMTVTFTFDATKK